MKKITISSFRLLPFLAAVAAIFFCLKFLPQKKADPALCPCVQISIEKSEIGKYKDLNKLYIISVALEKYKVEHRSYPLSEGQGKDWNTYRKKNGAINENWIDGLVPKYLDKLPQGGIENNDFDTQFRYKSNGANYKLIFTWPIDCDEIKLFDINLIEKHSNSGCGAYGFWTKNASEWRW